MLPCKSQFAQPYKVYIYVTAFLFVEPELLIDIYMQGLLHYIGSCIAG
jgi:hypothetical protein